MADPITLKADVELGVVPTHVKFVGGLVPDENGKLPRDGGGQLVVVAEMAKLCEMAPVKIDAAQITVFPGVDDGDTDELMTGLKDLGLKVYLMFMVGGADPMNPDDEEKVVEMLKAGLEIAKKYGVEHVASTSIEEWMQDGATPKTGADFAAAVAHLAKVHTRAVTEAGALAGGVKHWHFEFLRGGEFQTFTDVAKAWEVAKAANTAIGSKFFRVMVDAAHCGDSELSIPENQAVLAEIAAADEFSMFHASSKTTRGCLSTDDGWIGALLSTAAQTGKLQFVFVELFHHEDPALEPLRQLDPGHGIDTTDGRSYSQAVVDGLVDVARRLNNLVARGMLK